MINYLFNFFLSLTIVVLLVALILFGAAAWDAWNFTPQP